MSSIPLGIRGATGRLPCIHQARVKLFENVDYSQGSEGTDSGEERQVLKELKGMRRRRRRRRTRRRRRRRRRRRLRCNTRHSERANLATLVRRYDLTHSPPTIYDSQPDHRLNVHYALGKSDEPPQRKQVAHGPGSNLIRGSWLVLGWFCPLTLHSFDSSHPPRINHPPFFIEKTLVFNKNEMTCMNKYWLYKNK